MLCLTVTTCIYVQETIKDSDNRLRHATPEAQETFIDDDHNRWLPVNTKLVQIAHSDSGRILFLTRPMEENDRAEEYILFENGIGIHPTKIIEHKGD